MTALRKCNKLFAVLCVSGITVPLIFSNFKEYNWFKDIESCKLCNQSDIPCTKYNNHLSR